VQVDEGGGFVGQDGVMKGGPAGVDGGGILLLRVVIGVGGALAARACSLAARARASRARWAAASRSCAAAAASCSAASALARAASRSAWAAAAGSTVRGEEGQVPTMVDAAADRRRTGLGRSRIGALWKP